MILFSQSKRINIYFIGYVLSLYLLTVCPSQVSANVVYPLMTTQEKGSENTSGGSSGSTKGSLNRELMYVLGTLSLSGLIYGINSTSAKRDQFKKRFIANGRAFRKDLLRFNGPHYQWLIQTNLNIIEKHQARFKCELFTSLSKFKGLLSSAKSHRDEDFHVLYSFLMKKHSRARNRYQHRDLCALYERQQQKPQRFRKQLLKRQKGIDFDWVVNKHFGAKVTEAIRCNFKYKKKTLQRHLNQVEKQPVNHLNEFHNVLKTTVKSIEPSCRQ